MRVVCSACHQQFRLPEDKLPIRESFQFLCRHCGTKITVDGKGIAEEEKAGDAVPGLESRTGSPELQFETQGTEPETQEPEPAEKRAGVVAEEIPWAEEERQALVCLEQPSENEVVCNALEGLGYWPVSISDSQQAIEKMKFTQCKVVVLDEEFGGSKPDSNPVFQYLQFLPMSQRRGVFFVLVGKDFKSWDHITSFAKSANLVVNRNDLNIIKRILEKAIDDNARFYKVFLECMRETGKR